MKCVSNECRQIRAEIEKVGQSHYRMNYYGDYGFEEYLAKGVKNVEEFIGFIEKRVLKEEGTKNLGNKFGCAAFLARNENNDVILRRNMDCECGIGMVTRIKESKAYHSIALTNMCELDWEENTYNTLESNPQLTLAAPYSPSDGINEYGLAVAILSDYGAIYPKNHEITLLDYSIPRLLLNRARDVEEAVGLIQSYNLFSLVSPFHYMIADAAGHSAVVEFVNGTMVTTKNQFP